MRELDERRQRRSFFFLQSTSLFDYRRRRGMSERKLLTAATRETVYHLIIHAIGAAVSAVAFSFILTLISEKWKPIEPYKGYIFALALLIILYVAMRLFRSRTRTLPAFEKLECDFHIIDKEISIRFNSLEDILYTKKMTLKALRNGLDRMPDKYNWTGNGKVEVQSRYEEHRLVLGDRASVWQMYELKFDRVLNKGDSIDIAIDWKIEDRDKTANSFISTTIHEPTEKLAMKVFFADSFGVRQVICEEKADMGAIRPYSSKILPLVGGEAAWPVAKPKLLHYYEVRWTPHYRA
jgi:hypothetical protein